MENEKIDVLTSLKSKRRYDVLKGLSRIGGRKSNPRKNTDYPDKQEVIEIIKLLTHSDADIREEAVRVCGINWCVKEALLQIR